MSDLLKALLAQDAQHKAEKAERKRKEFLAAERETETWTTF